MKSVKLILLWLLSGQLVFAAAKIYDCRVKKGIGTTMEFKLHVPQKGDEPVPLYHTIRKEYVEAQISDLGSLQYRHVDGLSEEVIFETQQDIKGLSILRKNYPKIRINYNRQHGLVRKKYSLQCF